LLSPRGFVRFADGGPNLLVIQPFLGILALVAFCWVLSEKRRHVRVNDILIGLVVQFAIVVVLLKAPVVRHVFSYFNEAVSIIEESTRAGTSFVFGYLGGGQLPFNEKQPGSAFILAIRALPIVLVISALSSLFFYWRILPVIVRVFSWLFRKTMRIGGAVALGAAANVFLGMVESPLFVRPYIAKMTRSELFITMSCGMAGIAGTVMVLYASILRNVIPDALGHILVVSLATIPSAIMISRIMIPETEEATVGDIQPPATASSSMDAITQGTMEGIKLLVNIVSMLIVLVALVYLVNRLLGYLPELAGQPISLQRFLGLMMAPVVWLIGIPWKEALTAGSLMGTKTILNELIAYIDLANLPVDALSEKSRLIMLYALCGFANPGSLGIMIGGMGAMAPERRTEIIELGLKSVLSGTMATLMTGAIVAIIA
jgi:concentrative nucleoside transporter, CNT family